MVKKLFAGLIVIVVVVLMVSNLGTKKELAEAREALARAEEAEALSEQTDENQSVGKSDEQSSAEESVVPGLPAVEETVEEAPADEQANITPRRMIRSMSKMLENPAMNKMMVASQRGALGAMYEALMDQLELTGEDRDHFMDLLLARQMNMMDLSMKIMGGNLTQEEQAALAQELEEKNNQMKEEVEYFLNNADDVAEFEFYEKTLQDRMMLSQVDQALAGTGQEFSDQTYIELLEMMQEEKTSFDYSSDFHDQKNFDMSAERFSTENIQSFVNDMNTLNARIAERAQTILTAEQLDAFLSSQKSTAEMQQAQMEMAAQMFGGK